MAKNDKLENYINSNLITEHFIEAIEEFMKQSIKTNYVYSFEIEARIKRELEILNNHLKSIQDYEDERRLKKDDKRNDKSAS